VEDIDSFVNGSDIQIRFWIQVKREMLFEPIGSLNLSRARSILFGATRLQLDINGQPENTPPYVHIHGYMPKYDGRGVNG
jgi:hypothetical protein